MKLLVLLSMICLCPGTPVPEDAAAPLVLPYAGYPGLLAYPYSVPVVPSILHTGLHYPLAQAYVHDVTGDVADDAAPAAEAYVHDVSGDVSEAYIHDVTGDA